MSDSKIVFSQSKTIATRAHTAEAHTAEESV